MRKLLRALLQDLMLPSMVQVRWLTVDLYYLVGGLVPIKDQSSKADVHLADAEGVFHSVKAFSHSQSDGRWRYSSNNPESSAIASGMALETLVGTVSLASSELGLSLLSCKCCLL